RQKRRKLFRAAAWSTAWTTTAVRRRESLVEVEMNHVDAHVARPGDPDEGVHVGTVHVNETARFVNDVADLFDVGFEQAERVGISQHQTGDVAMCAEFAQVIEIRQTLRSRANRFD